MKEISLQELPYKLKEGAIILAQLDHSLSLMCDARNQEAMKTLRAMKARPSEKGFTILIDSDARLNRYVREVPALAWDIIDTSTEPIILVLPGGAMVSEEAMALDKTIAVRMVLTSNERQMVQAANGPIACSALVDEENNLAPTIDQGRKEVLEQVDYLLTLPTAKFSYPDRKIPIVALQLDGGVKVLRE